MKTLCDILERIREQDRGDLLRRCSDEDDVVDRMSAREFVAAVDRTARGLAAIGARDGDRIGFLCSNRPEWHVVDFACHRLGTVLVPLFPTLTPPEIGYAFEDSGCRIVVADSPEQLGKVSRAAKGLAALEAVVGIDAEAERLPSGVRSIPWGELQEAGDDDLPLPGPDDEDTVATIIYTSGTTGTPKGVMLTHGNFVANFEAVCRRLPPSPEDTGLSVLPLSHVYERTVDYAYLACGARIAYCDPGHLPEAFRKVRPTIMIGVPRLYERLRDAVEARVEASRAFDRWVYGLSRDLGMRRARHRQHGERPGLLDRLAYPLVERMVLSRIRKAASGGRIRMFSSGGAALAPELNWWYAALGWDLLQGYGLTESSPIISSNGLDDNKIGTVGRPLDNVEVKIAEDGEILTRGPHVMKGYWNLPEETERAIVDGWLHTGDVGMIDDEGYLSVTDRKKQILVTSTGKKVAPAPVENKLTQSPWIEQVMVIGDDRRFVAALIVPDWERVERWAEEHGLPADRRELADHERVRERIQEELDEAQSDLAPYERVRDFRLLARRFTTEEEQLTPTLKLIRRRIEQDYADTIEEIYAE